VSEKEEKEENEEKEEKVDQEEKVEREMSFLDHLEELRWHLIRSLSSILVFAVAAFVSKKIIFHGIILAPSRPDFWTYKMMCKLGMLVNSDVLCIEELPFIIQSRQMTGQFTMHIVSSLVIGLILAFPYTFWEIWRFISPGLYQKEKNVSQGAVFYVTMLFLIGISFGYFIVAPISINFLSHYQLDPSIQNEFDIISYVSTVTMLVLACGIMFQLPIIVYFLTKAGLVTPRLLKVYRKHAIIVILAVSAIITPPDVMSQVLIALPLILLYQLSILISRNVLRNDPDYLMLDENL
jgi:sec-independent protein translocase protein TatC